MQDGKLRREYSRISRMKNIWDAGQDMANASKARHVRAKRYLKELERIHARRQGKEECGDADI